MTSLSLRKTTRKDMPRIFEIRQAVTENKLDDTFEEYVDLAGPFIDGGYGWVWEENGQVIGEAGYDPEKGYIEVLYVDPVAQGRGIGAVLLEQCCKDLFMLGYETATLSTTANTRAERIYKKNGWIEIGFDRNGDLLLRKTLCY